MNYLESTQELQHIDYMMLLNFLWYNNASKTTIYLQEACA